jgi:hypothetical protein
MDFPISDLAEQPPVEDAHLMGVFFAGRFATHPEQLVEDARPYLPHQAEPVEAWDLTGGSLLIVYHPALPLCGDAIPVQTIYLH